MKNLISLFKGLPPEVRMLVAMAGLGTPIGMILFIKMYVFKDTPLWLVVLGVAVVVGVLCLLGWLVAKIFGRGRSKRTKKLEKDLASGAEAGPVSMDLRAAVKSNNEKFFNAIKEMRKLGISVYDLPWYVVLGDSGCGKTKLINEGGLTFSTGKPEGYQLGTLNYNWWFTEDAIFVDMAGRLCNPQDDADHHEWEAFLKTVGQGRRGFPINGVLACVSAEHLLQDPPEKLEQDANTMLERLRDLQNKLNVTFATYLLVTKCDKIVGFMPFFDRAERDITIKNQIFGFSRPGLFSELYDPERFGEDFNGVYTRLNELRLRRLNDDVDQAELGLAYSFPEEFRHIKEPLQTYVRTLFPAIKNPRAIKNLIFRGIYFTSATQQGGLILRHLTERLGQDAANQFQPLESLYPRPRPHFVKELLFRKVFPEQGLVFRNEQEVVRNRKLARVLMFGSGALAIVLLVLLFVSGFKFGKLIAEPRERARQAPALVSKPAEALTLDVKLGQDVDALKRSVWPTVLSLGIGASRPVTDLTRIQVALFEQSILRPVLAAADDGLRTAKIVPAAVAGTGRGGVSFPVYLAALEQYLLWYGCASRDTLPDSLDYGGFEKLCAVMPESPSPLLSQRKDIMDQAKAYFLTVRGLKRARNPARLFTLEGFDPTATVRAAIKNVHTYAERYATLSVENPDPVIHEWMRVRDACAQIDSAYAAMLAAAGTTVETEDQLENFRKGFEEQYDKLTKGMDECTWRGEKGAGFLRIPTLREAIKKQRQTWLDRQKTLFDAYSKCQAPAAGASDPAWAAITALIAGQGAELRGLDRVLADSIKDAGLADRGYFPDYFGDTFDKLVHEVDDAYAYVIALKHAGDAAEDDRVLLTDPLRNVVRPVLDKVHERLATLVAGGGKNEVASDWVDTLQRLLYPGEEAKESVADTAAFAKLDPRWQGDKLVRLNGAYQTLVRKGEGTVLLRNMEARLQQTATMGFGELAADWRSTQRSTYSIPVPVVSEAPSAPRKEKEAAAPPPLVKPSGGPPPLVKPKGSGPAPEQPKAAPPPAMKEGAGQVPKCATPEFWNDRARECVQLLYFLKTFGPEYYFARSSDTSPLNQRCTNLLEAAWKGYCERYAEGWSTAYKNKSLGELKRIGRWDQPWGAFAAQFEPSATGGENDARNAVRDEFQPALAEVLQATRWASFSSKDGWWPDPKDADYGAQNRRVTELWDTALQEKWTEGSFVRKAASKATTPDPRPWATLAADYTTRWVDWCNAVGKASKLPRKFDTDESAGKPLSIPWADIPTLRNDTGLGDEHLTGQLLDFQREAQKLLSVELSTILCGVQTDYFRDQAPYDGWPYMDEKGQGVNALETLPFDDLTKFLTAVQRADVAFKDLDSGLPDEPVRKARLEFLQSCKDWREFLRASAQGAATPLGLSLWIEDPISEPKGKIEVDDTAQQYYGQVCLAIGLRSQKAGETVTAGPLCFPTAERGKAKKISAVWEWSRLPDMQELTFSVKDGLKPETKNYTFPDIKPEILGKPSPLALCAYLHRYGRFADGNWFVTHGVRLPDKFKEVDKAELSRDIPADKQFVGEKFVFQLERNLPGPIRRLTPAAGGSVPGH